MFFTVSVCNSYYTTDSDIKQNEKGYPFIKNKDKLNHLLFMDDLKLYGVNEGKIDSVDNILN